MAFLPRSCSIPTFVILLLLRAMPSWTVLAEHMCVIVGNVYVTEP